MMKKAFYICLTLIYSFSLSSQDRIKNVLKYQILKGADDIGREILPIIKSDEQFKGALEIIDSIINSSGFKKNSYENFISKLKNIFGDFLINKYSYENIIHFDLNVVNNPLCDIINFSDDPYFYSEGSNKTGYHIIKDKQIISNFYYIPEILNYQKEFPEISKLENSPYQTILNEDTLLITRWKDIEDLPEQRRFNKQLLISRNKYLFNEDQSQFPWLITHDEFFMESLVKTFGYTEDERLLEWVVNRTLNSTEDEEYNKIFFTKDCQGNFILHKNTFSLIQKKISEKYLESLIYNYLKKIDVNKNLQSLNFEQKAEVLAYILYTGEAAAQKNFLIFYLDLWVLFMSLAKKESNIIKNLKEKIIIISLTLRNTGNKP